ncbi:hypothetical protein SmJEL517_g01740 [Synchytrium microbalum]|uniref:Importin N-terminal domain-containing protein n=1 Tax=Synchytrium microbalum TaxID=1806994 RepID=A0A507C4L6_9FUNG|nr:uncharacterized protein SmJEL517_g01740 [Synchytrium microbalum]TPX35927.1 hypothetical protein SmJEL517_g01740 [Synchytrium microbalum]
MDPNTLNQVVEALNTIFNPSSTNDQRRIAQQFCESVKEAPTGPIVGHFLARKDSGQPDVVRHFGLSALEHGIRFHWAQYTAQEREQIRNCVVDLVQNGTKDILIEPLYIKEKCARLFVEVAKRMWPGQAWDNADRLLRQLYDATPTTREVVLLILRSLAEDVFVFEDAVAELRKRELCSAMMASAISSHLLEQERQSRLAETQNANGGGMVGVPAATATGAVPISVAGMSRKLDVDMLSNLHQMDQNNEGWLARWSRALGELHDEWRREGQIGNAPASSIAEKLCVATLNAIQMYLDWVWLSSLVECKLVHRIIELLISDSPSIRLAAAECLTVLGDRHIPPTDTYRDSSIIEPVFSFGLDTMFAAWARSHNATTLDPSTLNTIEQTVLVPEQEYAFLKRFVQAYTLIGENHVCMKKQVSVVPQSLNKYLTLMILIADHPSLLLSSSTDTFFSEILKHENFKNTAEIQAIMPKLLEHSIEGISTSVEISEVSKYYRDLDFATTSEYNMYLQTNRVKIKEIVKSIVALKPVESFQWLIGRIQSTLVVPVESSSLNEKGMLTPQAPVYRAFETTANLVEIMVPGIPVEIIKGTDASKIAIHQQLLPLMQQAVQAIINYVSNDSSILRFQISMILPFAAVLSTSRDLLMATLTKLFSMVSFTMLSETNAVQQRWPMSEETKIVRIKACTSLSKLGVVMADELFTVYDQITGAIAGLIQKGLLFEEEHRHLAEAQITILHYSSLAPDEKRLRLKVVVDPYIQNWASVPMAEFASSPTNFMTFLGIDVIASNVDTLNRVEGSLETVQPALYEKLMQRKFDRNKVGLMVAALTAFLRRTVDTRKKNKHPLGIPPSSAKRREKRNASSPPPPNSFWKEFLPNIVPNVLLLIQSIHSLWDIRAWEGLPPELSSIRDISPPERQFYVFGTATKRVDDDGTEMSAGPSGSSPEELDRQMQIVRLWLVHMRENCYHMLALLTYIDTDLYTLPGFSEALTTSLFSAALHLDNRHWKSLITTALPPLIMHCPPGNPLLHLVLPPFFEYVTKRLDSEWGSAAAKGGFKPEDEENGIGVDDEDKMEDVSDEIVFERILRDFTRSVAEFLATVFAASIEKPPPPAPRPVFANEELAEYILSNATIYTPMLHCLARLIVYEDTKSSRRALSTMIRLVPVMCRSVQFASFLGRDVLIASLTTLHDGYHTEVHNEAVALVAEIHLRLRFGQNSTIPYETMLSLPDMTPQRLDAFETELKTKTSPKDQQAVVKLFLQGITGMAISQWFVRKDSFVLSSGPKERLQNRPAERDSHRGDIIEGTGTDESVGIDGMFASS